MELDEKSVIIVGERLAQAPGGLSAALELSARTGARLAWIPRRAGERGAVEAGCLPNLLPGGRPVTDPSARVDTATAWESESLPTLTGRSAEEIFAAAAGGDIAALLVGGIQPSDFADPALVRSGLENAGFVISLESRESAVTERADVVLPVGLLEERSGSFLNWEGRNRAFDVVIKKPNTMNDLRVLAALADGLGHDLGVRTTDQARSELAELGPWEGVRAAAPAYGPPRQAQGGASTGSGPFSGSGPFGDPHNAVLATWRLHIDDAKAIDGEPHLAATARRPVARLSSQTADAAGIGAEVIVSTSRGSVSFPTEIVPDMTPGVVWLPARTPGLALSDHLAVGSGEVVRIEGVTR